MKDPADDTPSRRGARVRRRRILALTTYSLVLVLATVVATLAIERGGIDRPPGKPPEAATTARESPTAVQTSLTFGAQDAELETVTVPAGTANSALISFDLKINRSPVASPQAALVSARIDCSSDGRQVQMSASGKVSTNVLLARGGEISGQALAPPTDEEMTCSLRASAPFINAPSDGVDSLPVSVSLDLGATDRDRHLALHRLDDATLVEPGAELTVLSLQVDDPRSLDSINSTVRLTSCTVVGGSRDAGENKCQPSMTGTESSTVGIRVIARWLDEDGAIESTSTYWDEILAIDHDTHHVPWNLRLQGMASKVPDNATAVVLVVQVDSLAGTPVVVHADGTDAVISTLP
ncbi:hypothetical protein ACFQRD_07485 [Brachybacterium sp. GCM10030268]|uniref:hypothetical protein n=1 Tax=Brachybacterium sp. GCM10030268 TaxID=3273382 RepID=UPI00360C09EF